MKCDNCPALTNVGTYEYPEYGCYLVDDDDVVEFKDGSLGCRRKSYKKIERDVERQRNIEGEAWRKFAESFVDFASRQENQHGK
ncbi:hypothetical protein ACWG0P_13915 [Amedibacillus sp. YH-ame6]